MSRRVRRLALVLAAVVLIAVVVLVLTSRPRLEDDRDAAKDVWTEDIRGPLSDRYQRLTDVVVQLREAGAGDRDVTEALARELDRWDELRRASDPDVAAEVETSNRLEGLWTRAQASIARSPRLSASEPLLAARQAFVAAAPPPPAVEAYNRAAEEYQDTREALRYGLVAGVFGYDALPTSVLGTRPT
jgi:hypothetical protein